MLLVRCYEVSWSQGERNKQRKVSSVKSKSQVFLVGIGGVNSHIPNVQLMTGPRAWDQQVPTFGSSDYVTNANYAQLGALLNAVAKGLCPCLQDQAGCQAFAGGPTCDAQSNFDARVGTVHFFFAFA